VHAVGEDLAIVALASYRNLDAWKKAMLLVEEAYRLTADLPADERFGLTSQMRRAAVSIPANIAEGYGRVHRGDDVHHLSMSSGSLAELETLLTVAVRLRLIGRARAVPCWKLAQDEGKILNKLIASLRSD
jgi:four helix bundle protein